MKNVKVFINQGKYGSKVVTYTYNRDCTKEEILADVDDLIRQAKEENPKAEFVDVLIPTKSRIKKDRLMRIGQEVASGWGAICTSVKTYLNSVCFECQEYDEKFTTHMSYDRIEKEYAYVK